MEPVVYVFNAQRDPSANDGRGKFVAAFRASEFIAPNFNGEALSPARSRSWEMSPQGLSFAQAFVQKQLNAKSASS